MRSVKIQGLNLRVEDVTWVPVVAEVTPPIDAAPAIYEIKLEGTYRDITYCGVSHIRSDATNLEKFESASVHDMKIGITNLIKNALAEEDMEQAEWEIAGTSLRATIEGKTYEAAIRPESVSESGVDEELLRHLKYAVWTQVISEHLAGITGEAQDGIR